LALRESEGAKWERATNALRAGGITVNDYRRTVGLAPVEGGDVFLTPAGVLPTELGAKPGDGPGAPAPPAPSSNGSSSNGQPASAAKYALDVLQGGKHA
jgi:hypothetical protein